MYNRTIVERFGKEYRIVNMDIWKKGIKETMQKRRAVDKGNNRELM